MAACFIRLPVVAWLRNGNATTAGSQYTSLADCAEDVANLSQAELSQLRKSPQSFVSKYETGERYLTFTEVLVLCKMLHIDLPALIAEVDSDI